MTRITREVLQEILRDYTRDSKVTVQNFTCEPACEIGGNFTSEANRITVNVGNYSASQIKLIVKEQLANTEIVSKFKLQTAFLNEAAAYFKIIPELQKILSIAAPHCLYADESLTVLGDLSEHGYKSVGKEGLDLKQIKEVLRELAKLHSASFILSVRNRAKLEELSRLGAEMVYERDNSFLETQNFMLKTALEIFRKYDHPKQRVALEVLENLLENHSDLLCEIMHKPRRLKVLTHGDCWENNILVKEHFEEISGVTEEILKCKHYFICTENCSCHRDCKENCAFNKDNALQEHPSLSKECSAVEKANLCPLKENSASIEGNFASTNENSATSKENSATSKENSASLRENLASSTENSASLKEKLTSGKENSFRENFASSKENSASTKENLASTNENSASTKENSVSNKESTALTNEQANSALHKKSSLPKIISVLPKASTRIYETSIKLIDFQAMRFTSVAADLSYFLYVNKTPQFRKEHLRELLNFYLTNVRSYVRCAGVDVAELTEDWLNGEMREFRVFGLMNALWILPVHYFEKEDLVMNEYDEEEQNRKYGEIFWEREGHEEFVEIVKALVLEYIEGL